MTVTIDGTNGVTSPGITDTGNLSVSGTSAFTGSVGNITAGTVTASGLVTGATGALYPIVNGTAVASTSGTSITFSSIPSWVKRVIVSFSGVSTSGTSEVQMQIGTSGGVQNTGYLGTWGTLTSAGVGASNATSGFLVNSNGGGATYLRNGSITLSLLDLSTGLWAAQGLVGCSDNARISLIGGSKTLSGTLDRVVITTVNGTDTFDAGSINIQYE
jgi:hypothetical protein